LNFPVPVQKMSLALRSVTEVSSKSPSKLLMAKAVARVTYMLTTAKIKGIGDTDVWLWTFFESLWETSGFTKGELSQMMRQVPSWRLSEMFRTPEMDEGYAEISAILVDLEKTDPRLAHILRKEVNVQFFQVFGPSFRPVL